MARRVKLSNPIESSGETLEVQSNLITYSAFFHECLHKGMVKSWQERELYTFFRGLGLLDKEPSHKYIDALAKY